MAQTSSRWVNAAYYVDRILKGTNAADLPVEQPTKFVLALNLKCAKTLGVTVPPALLATAASAAAREEEAIGQAREAYDTRDPNCQIFFSRYAPSALRLYGYPRFREIIAQMGRSEWLCDQVPLSRQA